MVAIPAEVERLNSPTMAAEPTIPVKVIDIVHIPFISGQGDAPPVRLLSNAMNDAAKMKYTAQRRFDMFVNIRKTPTSKLPLYSPVCREMPSRAKKEISTLKPTE